MELSFTQGRGNNERWGVGDPIAQLAAVGVELTAFPEAKVDSTWGNLTHALSGLFCASINFLESPTTFLEPWFSWRPEANRTGGGGAFDAPGMKRVVKGKKWSKSSMTRYGALPREALCTENLTPWLTLLPCRGKAGLTTLLDRQTIYSGMMFGSKLVGKCPLATTSSVYLEMEESLAKHLAGDLSEETGINFVDSRVFSLNPAPSRVLASSSGSLSHTASLISASLGEPRWIGLRLGVSSTQAGIEAAEDDTEIINADALARIATLEQVQGCAWSIDATHLPSIPGVLPELDTPPGSTPDFSTQKSPRSRDASRIFTSQTSMVSISTAPRFMRRRTPPSRSELDLSCLLIIASESSNENGSLMVQNYHFLFDVEVSTKCHGL
ncbi:hypothetical protein SELMODRAFT_416270 [Selaginella moellendorffii]|uniref:Uncharacterized protein n=1 Tax=Selaginella moellendorffii TaxID=88036 RepID=D8RYR7_SELML|nr:hypothetical protein SELMODRAFT_416270 [Selaginella moellendorffii]